MYCPDISSKNPQTRSLSITRRRDRVGRNLIILLYFVSKETLFHHAFLYVSYSLFIYSLLVREIRELCFSLDICPCVARGNKFVSICTIIHVFYGLHKHTNNFSSMSMTMHMACGLDEHIKKYTNLIT